MPAISKIRLTNVVYEDGDKRFNDETYLFDGYNGAILLENGGGKTVFIHTVLQAILPHTNLGERKIKETLQLENAPAHIGIEWIISEKPRRYLTTAVSLFLNNNKLDSYRYVFEYEHNHPDDLSQIPFVVVMKEGKRPAYKEEITEYFTAMKNKSHNARTFDTISGFNNYIEEQYQIITNEWENLVKINSEEGGIEKFFENCKTTTDLYDRLLIPTVEDSIAGHEQGMFADMFEKQREGFQTYRNLQKSMEEHQAIQTELGKYVGEFERYTIQQAAYESAKQRAKGVAETLGEQKDALEKENFEHEKAWEAWQREKQKLRIKTASFHILKEQEKAETLYKYQLEKMALYEEQLAKFHENERMFYSLRHSQLQQECMIHQQLADQYKDELNKHELEGEVKDYQAELELENAKLHGFYLTQLETLEKEINHSKMELRPIKETIDELNKQRQSTDKAFEEENKAYNQLKGQLTSKQEHLKKLEQQLLSNPDQETVDVEFKKWAERHQSLDEEVIRLKQHKKTIHQQLIQLNNQLDEEKGRTSGYEMKLNHIERDEKQMQGAHDALIKQLAFIRPSWQAVDNLHLKEEGVYRPLIDLRGKLEKERESHLYHERLAHRFVDDYGEQESFFTDAYLAEKLIDWQNQFYLMTGTEFYSNLNEHEQEKFVNYPLWPLTLITRKADQNKLIAKVTEVKKQLQFPIIILTLEQVKQLGNQVDVNSKSWVAPAHWHSNLDSDYFLTWKHDLTERAQASTTLRIEKEEEIQNCQKVIDQFEQFFQLYPKKYADKLRERKLNFQKKKEEVTRRVTKIKSDLEFFQNELTTTENNMVIYSGELNGLEIRIDKATDFFQLKREASGLTKEQTEREQNINALTKELHQLNLELSRYETDRQIIEEKINGHKQQMAIINENQEYKDVKTYRAIYTDELKEILLKRREELQLAIHGIQQSYREVVTKLEQAKIDINRVKQDIDEVIKGYNNIDKAMGFPIDGVRLLQQRRESRKPLKNDLDKLSSEQLKAKENAIKQDSRVATMKERYYKDFANMPIFQFDVNVAEIESMLQTTNHKINERHSYLQLNKERIHAELKDIQYASRELEKFEIAHHFNNTLIDAVKLTEAELTDFAYERKKYVKKVTDSLKTTYENLESAKTKIDQAKHEFRKFCRDQISERKLREMATGGIEHKTNYEDVLDFQQNMLTTVERADQYARNFIRDKDKEVQAFINTVHNHLLNVTDQLKLIPKNTKVKTGEQWKEIFQFTIPEWSEEDGKERIRQHMDWILEQLETDRFKSDPGKIRKEIETWLHTKQLLQVVMDHKGMKASCRKVTNDNQVTRRFTPWEQSNQWSGGEKWSKNMTLFLGILNFVAEKKQHIRSKMKRHRAVILDNPFGKASSDHVLNPVFFIAEQLGFQVIAFTAHADGKFLQDYFPIIYSLRLRLSMDASTKVMTKDKSLKHAYFQDHEPVEMKRLEEIEQLELL